MNEAEETFQVIDMRVWSDFFIPIDTIDLAGPIIGPLGIAVYVVLARHDYAGHGGEYGAEISHQGIASALGCSIEEIERTMNLLEHIGLVEVEAGGGKVKYHIQIMKDST